TYAHGPDPRPIPSPTKSLQIRTNKSGRPDSNRGPHRPERCALPGCATPRGSGSIPHPIACPDDAMSALTTDILAEANRLLAPERFDDYGPNGLQVPGSAEVNVLASGVSAHAELFELAAGAGAQLLLVHHGLFWGAGTQVIDPVLKRRLQILFEADIALAAYHLPLDAHPEIGNNALIARALGAGELRRFAEHRGEPIGILATLPGD